MKISILGCSYSDYYYQEDELSYTYFLAHEYQNSEITNFAISASSVDYMLFVLDWMVETNWDVDCIIMNYPPMYRKMHWLGEGYKLEKSPESIYKFKETDQDNVKVAALHECMGILHAGTEIYHTIDEKKANILGINDQVVAYYKRTMANANSINIFSNYAKHKMLPHYEKLLDTKIFYYSHNMHTQMYAPSPNISNFKDITATEFMNEKTENFLLDYSHFNTYGNEYLYENYLKQGELGDFLERHNN